MPIDPRRRDDIVATVAAYDRTNPEARLPRNAARLLAATARQQSWPLPSRLSRYRRAIREAPDPATLGILGCNRERSA